MDGDCENRANVHLSSCMCKHVCMCVCVCVCVQPNPIGRVYFVAGRGKQMAGCVAELYGVQHTHTHTHTLTLTCTHTKRERETIQAGSVPPITQPPLHPNCHTEPHRTTQTVSHLSLGVSFLHCFPVFSSRSPIYLNETAGP